MRTKEFKKIKVVESHSGAEFERLYNEAMAELAGKNPQEIIKLGEGHCAYICYTESEEEPENIRDEYSLRGVSYVCGECPYFNSVDDKRVKHGICNMAGRKVRSDSYACLFLYQQIASGVVSID